MGPKIYFFLNTYDRPKGVGRGVVTARSYIRAVTPGGGVTALIGETS